MNEFEAQVQIKSIPDKIWMQISKDDKEAIKMANMALVKQEKIKEIIENANTWSKEDVVVKAQAFCDIEKILRSDEE